MFKIIKKERLNPTVTKMVIDAPFIAKKAEPGQFIILRALEDSERIPLTIADYDREGGTITIIYQIVGGSTMELDTLEEGQCLHDFVGPLGIATHTDGLKKVAVVGGGNSAVSEALLLSRLCRHVSLVHRRSTFRASAAELAALEKQDNVTFCRNSIVTELLGRERLTGIRLQNGRELEISGLFVCIGRTPVSALGGEQLRRTPDGYYCADETTRTGLPGVFAAGDVREKQLRQIVTAVSDGAAAAQQAEHYLGKTSRRAEI